jgi:hypothetical protein
MLAATNLLGMPFSGFFIRITPLSLTFVLAKSIVIWYVCGLNKRYIPLLIVPASITALFDGRPRRGKGLSSKFLSNKRD